jgi:hypothetical protein
MKAASLMLALCAVIGCSSLTGPQIRQVSGTVRFSTIEGGFFYIRGDDSISYTPTNRLIACYEKDGLRIQATLKIEKDVGSVFPGTLVEVESIQSPVLICST